MIAPVTTASARRNAQVQTVFGKRIIMTEARVASRRESR
jgi:hypothetical protein